MTMKLDHYRTLGGSGLKVSPFCLGAMTFGEDWGFGADAATSARIIDAYADRGGNFIDTANLYTRGNSERIIGDHLAGDPAKRQRLVIATKFSANMVPGDPNGGGASRRAIVSQCDASLQRLRTDHIDLYWQHWDDPFTPIEETMQALDDLVRAGKVLYVGFSDTPAWKVATAQLTARFRGWAPLVALQIEYSLLERTVEGELIPMAIDLGLGVTPWSPLRGGMLSGKYGREAMQAESPGRQASLDRNRGEHAFAVVDLLREVAGEAGTTPARVALAWLIGRPGVASPIIGARTVEQLDDNLAALELALPAEAVMRLDEASRPQLNFPAHFLPETLKASYPDMNVNGRNFARSPRS
jgi:aryl-alcohol dehydrogenase-like predicted oxidoreductase